MVDLFGHKPAASWSPIFLMWVLGTGLVVLTGPFGTYVAMPFWERLLYWSALNALAMAGAIFLRRQVDYWVLGPGPLTEILRCAILAGFLGPVLWSYNAFVYQLPVGSLPGPLPHIFIVFCVAVTGAFGAGRLRPRTVMPAPDPDLRAPEVPFLRRLAPHLGQDVLRVSADDHYLTVATERGQDRVLMRFTDALEDLRGHPGLRIHRSHWIAIKAIDRFELEGRRTFVILRDGTRLPVSRAYRSQLRSLGLDA